MTSVQTRRTGDSVRSHGHDRVGTLGEAAPLVDRGDLTDENVARAGPPALGRRAQKLIPKRIDGGHNPQVCAEDRRSHGRKSLLRGGFVMVAATAGRARAAGLGRRSGS